MVYLKINDHFLDLVPRSSKHEMQILTESIMKNGLREPIVISKNHFILDGHTRFEICQNLGIKPKYRIMRFDSYEEEEEYVVESNMERRHVNNFQKIEIYYKYYDQLKKRVQAERIRDKFGRVTSQKVYGVRSISILAEKLKLSVNQIQCGLWLVNNSNSLTKSRLRNGTITINKAFDNIKRSNYNIKRSNYNSVPKSVSFKSIYTHFSGDPKITTFLSDIRQKYISDIKNNSYNNKLSNSEYNNIMYPYKKATRNTNCIVCNIQIIGNKGKKYCKKHLRINIHVKTIIRKIKCNFCGNLVDGNKQKRYCSLHNTTRKRRNINKYM